MVHASDEMSVCALSLSLSLSLPLSCDSLWGESMTQGPGPQILDAVISIDEARFCHVQNKTISKAQFRQLTSLWH